MFRKKTNFQVVIAQDLTSVMFEEWVIPVPNYSRKEHELIVLPRGIRSHKIGKKKPLKW